MLVLTPDTRRETRQTYGTRKRFMQESLFGPTTTRCSVLLLLLAAIQARACGPGSTTITGLSDPAGDTFQVSGLNSKVQLTGYFIGATPPHAFLFSNGALSDLGTLGGPLSQAVGINSSAQVTGSSYRSDYSFRA